MLYVDPSSSGEHFPFAEIPQSLGEHFCCQRDVGWGCVILDKDNTTLRPERQLCH